MLKAIPIAYPLQSFNSKEVILSVQSTDIFNYLVLSTSFGTSQMFKALKALMLIRNLNLTPTSGTVQIAEKYPSSHKRGLALRLFVLFVKSLLNKIFYYTNNHSN